LGVLVLALGACSQAQGRAPLGDGNEITIEGRGTKTSISVKCLTEAEIKQLTGSRIDPLVPKASCYTVAFVAAESSSISKAITAYARAESEMNDTIADSITGGRAPRVSSAGGELAKKIVSESLTKDARVVEQGARETMRRLDDKTKREARATLQAISATATDPLAKARIDAALAATR